MTTIGGPAQAVSITTTRPTGIVAYTVTASTPSTVGRAVEGGPATPVYLVSQAQLDSGEFILEGTVPATPMCAVTDGRTVEGGLPIPVFVVSGSF